MSSPKSFDHITFTARFGCGFLFGGLAIGFRFLDTFIPAFLIGGIIFGLLAWRFGDPVWKLFVRIFR